MSTARIHSFPTLTGSPRRPVARLLSRPDSMLGWVNLGLAFAAAVLLVYYVMQMNLLASNDWQMRALQDRLTEIRQDRDTLVAQQSGLEDRSVLQELAVQQGMVPAGTVVYLMQDSAVAAR